MEDSGEKAVVLKMKSLRTNYNQQKARKKDEKKSGSGVDTIHVHNSPWLDIMKRILDNSKPNNLQKSTIDALIATVENEEDIMEADFVQSIIEDEPVYLQTAQEVPSRSRSRKRKAFDLEETVRTLDSIVSRCQPTKPSNPDQLDCFGQYIVAQLRTLDKNVQLELQEKIQSIVMETLKYDV